MWKVPLLAVAVFLGWACFENPAQAKNGFIYVVQCSTCTTAQGFISAAENAAQAHVSPTITSGTYEVVSSAQPSAAYIQVKGTYVSIEGTPYLEISSVTPVDASGNSLSGETAAELMATFAALDQTLFGANRSLPTSVNVPDDYASSFINSSDEEVVPGIGYALIQMGVNQGAIPAGTLITAHFQDGSSAQYNKAPASQSSYQWIWNGIAFNAAHNRIYRNGTMIGNMNTAGIGGGAFVGPGFGSGAPYNFSLIGQDLCTVSFTTSFDGIDYDLGSFTVPC